MRPEFGVGGTYVLCWGGGKHGTLRVYAYDFSHQVALRHWFNAVVSEQPVLY
jgi:hypothetical protein